MTTERWYLGTKGDALFATDYTMVCREPDESFDGHAHWPRRSRLIAAAPDLYDALVLIQEWDGANPRYLGWADDVRPAIEDALAKARPAKDANPAPWPDLAATVANDVPEPAKKTKKRKTLMSIHARLIKAMDDYTALVGDKGYAVAILSEDEWELLANVSRFDDTPPYILRAFEKALAYARGRNPNNKKMALEA